MSKVTVQNYEPDELLTIGSAGREIGASHKSVWTWVQEGLIDAVEICGTTYVPRQSIKRVSETKQRFIESMKED